MQQQQKCKRNQSTKIKNEKILIITTHNYIQNETHTYINIVKRIELYTKIEKKKKQQKIQSYFIIFLNVFLIKELSWF